MTDKEILECFKYCYMDELTSKNYDCIIFDNMMKSFDDYQCGCTKIAFDFSDHNEIIKIPFAGLQEEAWEFGDDTYYEFCAAPYTGNDYCGSEVCLYNEICTKYPDFAKFFVEVRLVGKVHDYPIYAQTKCKVLADIGYSGYDKMSERMKRYYDSHKGIPYINWEWSEAVIEAYGEDTFTQLMNVCDEFGIDDLHAGNIGYLEGLPVIFDYGNFLD